MIKSESNYDLETRTLEFSRNLIAFLKKCPKNNVALPLTDQCLRAGTSVGANYREANGASSKKDFFNKIYICKKEAKETQYWFELLDNIFDEENLKQECKRLLTEAKEYVLIFGKIVSNIKN